MLIKTLPQFFRILNKKYSHHPNVMDKNLSLTSSELHRRTEELIQGSNSRYQIAVQVAKRAKRFRYEDFENPHSSDLKPILRAILEMSDELTQPELLAESYHLLS